jgi:hypothetical protein
MPERAAAGEAIEPRRNWRGVISGVKGWLVALALHGAGLFSTD